MYAFDYHKPASVADAAAALAGASDGKFLAGGMTLIPTLKQRLASPSDLVDLAGIAELRGIAEEGGALVIRAMTTHAEVAASDVVRRSIPAIAALAEGIGDAQVRHRGTIGGSLANDDPTADYPAAVLALGATIRTNRRTLAAEQFFQGLFTTALDPDEILTAVAFPRPQAAAYAKFPNPASRYAIVGVFVARTGGGGASGGAPSGVRVAVTGAGQDGVFRWPEAEQALSANFSPAALDPLTLSPSGLNSDIHASAEYRANLVKVMAKRAVGAAG